MEKLNCLHGQLISISEKPKEIQNKLLGIKECSDEHQSCKEYYFEQNSRLTDLVLKVQEYCKKFSDQNFSEASKSKSHLSNASSCSSSSSHTKSSISNILFQKVKPKLIVS